MKEIKNKSTYIMSLEGAQIYSHMNRGEKLNKNYVGMIPFSLELIKLKKEKLKVKINNKTEKETSDDVINVKFKQKVQNGQYIIKKLNKKILEVNKTIEEYKNELKEIKKATDRKKLEERINKSNLYKEKVEEFIRIIQNEINEDKWKEVQNDVLREQFYKDGFTLTEVDKKTGEITENKYVVYKRSSAKSRTGQCLFIKEDLHDRMIEWSRMGLDFNDNKEYDFAGLLAYESLVSSSLEDTIKINPDNILIVDDVDSKFIQMCNVVRKDKTTGFLNSFEEEFEVKNSLFDGEGLLESKYFKEGQSMILLRQHTFKDAAFNCNIQKFLKDNCPEGQNYDTWELKNKYGEPIFAKDVHMVICPTSLKLLKFAKDLEMTEQEAWNYWKNKVKEEENISGICKHEKESKRGYDSEGNILQQTSYQMINSIPFSTVDIKELTTFEKDYIMKLKNDDDFFINYITENVNEMNSNLMFSDLAKHNKDFIGTELFRDFRKGEINRYVTHVKKGKIRLKGDYCVVLGNPIEYLFHALGKLEVNDPKPLALIDNEIYTTLFKDDEELVCFRNPHTSPSNCLLAKNKYIADIDKYFNLTKNIMCCNAINFPIQDIASSMDYDSDSMVVFNDSTLTEVIKEKIWKKYNVCINDVEANKKSYVVTKENMSKIDNQLSTSQGNIGLCVNGGQHIMSTFWDLLYKGETSEKELKELLKKVDVATVLSCICIDLAKKMYDININEEIENLSQGLGKTKPLFFKYISQSKTIENRVEKYDTPMDYLYEEMNSLDYADDHKNVELLNLLIEKNLVSADRKQENKILNYVEEMCNKIKSINAKMNKKDATEDEIKEKNNALNDVIKYYNYYMQKATVKEDTMYSILYHMIKNNKFEMITKLMNILYTTQKETFLNVFIKGE